MDKLAISAVVVGRNEEAMLGPCLESLAFCAEILFADMQSGDSSKLVAKRLGAKVLDIQPSPKVEDVRQSLTGVARFPWVLHLDPDERASPELVQHILAHWHSFNSDSTLAAVKLPFFYYAFGKKLKGTMWGGEKTIPRLVHRDRYFFSTLVHTEGVVRDASFSTVSIAGDEGREVTHLWLTNLGTFVEKRVRYVRAEGPSRFAQGIRSGFFKPVWVFPKQFLVCYLKRRGYRDGFLGLLLSLFWGLYQTASEVSLLREQYKNRFRACIRVISG